MSLTREQFIQRLDESSLMSTADVETLIAALPTNDQPQDGEQLARLLVQQQQLTAFQAQQIYAGRQQSLVLGNYTILDKLGQGGMGMVLKAEHRRMHRLVALKILSPAATKTPGAVQRFHREVEAAAKLEHTNIVTAYDADESGGTHFLVMQYVAGKDLSVLVKKKGTLAVDKAVNCILQAARGLQYAHEQGVIHRDIKPANLLVDAKGTVQILDMGLARIESTGGNADQAELTSTGQIMGTVDYMAPEQALNTKAADARSDIYSLGITLWYILTGRAAYEGATLTSKLLAHQQSPIPSLASACSGASAQLDTVFQKMVAKQPADRQQTMAEVVTDLERCLSPTASAPTITTTSSEDSKFQAFISNLESDAPPTIASPDKTQAPADNEPAIDHSPTISYDSSAADTNPQVEVRLNATTGSASKTVQKSKLPINLRDRRLQIGTAAAALLIVAGLIWGLTGNRNPVIENPNAPNTAPPKPTHPEFAIAPFNAKQAESHQQAWADYLELPVEYTNELGMKFRLIPPGVFDMGSTFAEVTDVMQQAKEYGEGWEQPFIQSEAPRHKVRITKPFYLGVYEVTYQEFQRVMTDQRPFSRRAAGGMTFEEMVECCKRIGNLSGSDKVGRLPTEAEWEYACRAGTTTHFAFGDSLSAEQANFEGEFPFGDAPKIDTRKGYDVGTYQPNPFGLYDMHGNHWEMCSDWYSPDYYKESPLDDPTGPQFGTIHVERGGDYQKSRGFTCRSAFRHAYKPPWGTTGFRVALTINSPKLKNITPPAVQQSSPTTSPTNHALSLDGNDDYVSLPDLATTVGGTFTMEAWVKPDRLYGHGAVASFWGKTIGGIGVSPSHGGFSAYQSTPQANYWTPGGIAQPAQWQHICMTAEPNRLRLFVDGRLVAEDAAPDVIERTYDTAAAAIGCAMNPETGQLDTFYRGLIDDVRLSKGVRYTNNFNPTGNYRSDKSTVAFYDFEQTQDTTIPDASVHGHNGLLHGGEVHAFDASQKRPQPAPVLSAIDPVDGPHLEFTPIGGRVYSQFKDRPPTFQVKQPATIEADALLLAEPDAETTFPIAQFGGFSVGLATASRQWGIQSDEYRGALYRQRLADGTTGTSYVRSPYPAPVGQWVHLATVWSDDRLKFYVNGRKVSELDIADQAGPTNDSILKIGAYGNKGPGFPGYIANVRLSKVARYKTNFVPQTQHKPDADTLLLYPLNEGKGQIAHDLSSNKLDAPIIDAKWVANTNPKTNTALSFNGKDSYVEIPSLRHDGSRPITIEAIVYHDSQGWEERKNFVTPPRQKQLRDDVILDLAGTQGTANILIRASRAWAAGDVTATAWKATKLYVPVAAGWSHIAIVYRKDTHQIFANGMLAEKVDLKNGTYTANFDPKKCTTAIGAALMTTKESRDTRHFKGRIAAVRISNGARYEKNFKPLGPNDHFIKEENTLALYHFNEGQGTEAIDSSGNNHHGKIVNARWVAVESQPPNDPDRNAASRVLQAGGFVTLQLSKTAETTQVKQLDALPTEKFALRSIYLSNVEQINDAFLQSLANLRELHGLHLHSTAITDDGLKSLAAIDTLRNINLYGTQITDAGLQHLAAISKLHSITLSLTPAESAGLTGWRNLKSLRSVLVSGEMTKARLIELSAVGQLRELRIGGDAAHITPAVVAEFHKQNPHCRIRILNGPIIGRDPVRELAQWVQQQGGRLTLEGLKSVSGFPDFTADQKLPEEAFRIRAIDLNRNEGITDADLARFTDSTFLHELKLGKTNISDAGVEHLANCTTLGSIWLDQTQITDRSLETLSRLPNLAHFYLHTAQISPNGLKALLRNPQIQTLSLGGENITGEALGPISRMTELRSLSLWSSSNIGDADIQQLATLGKLEKLDISGTKVTPTAAKQLSKALPHCTISYGPGNDRIIIEPTANTNSDTETESSPKQ